jgi:translation initiation factor IF-3
MFIRKPFFFKKFHKGPRIVANEQIRAPQVQVIDETGKNLGILDTNKAIELAKEKELDLVEISSKTQPPICKIIDYGKYQYILEKKNKKQKAQQRKFEVKEIRIGFTTSPHDLEIKARKLEDFLKEGHKVKVDMKLRGREKAHGDLAREKLNTFLTMITVDFKMEEEIKRTPMGFTLLICLGKPKNQ